MKALTKKRTKIWLTGGNCFNLEAAGKEGILYQSRSERAFFYCIPSILTEYGTEMIRIQHPQPRLSTYTLLVSL